MLEQLIDFVRQASVTPITDDINAVAIPSGMNIASLLHLRDSTPGKAGIVKAETLDALVDYVNRFHTPETAVFATGEKNCISAVLDWHPNSLESDKGRFGRHTVTLPLRKSDEWTAWTGINNLKLGQRALAEFIEEHLDAIVEPDAAAVLEVVLTLSGKKSVAYKNAVRLANGDTSLVWEETTDAKAGQSGELKVPSELKIRIPVYAGCEDETTFEIRTMFRYHIHDGALTFQLKMLGIERIHDLAFKAVHEALCEKLTAKAIIAPVYQGYVASSPLVCYTSK